jgi:hypothetical protein
VRARLSVRVRVRVRVRARVRVGRVMRTEMMGMRLVELMEMEMDLMITMVEPNDDLED